MIIIGVDYHPEFQQIALSQESGICFVMSDDRLWGGQCQRVNE